MIIHMLDAHFWCKPTTINSYQKEIVSSPSDRHARSMAQAAGPIASAPSTSDNETEPAFVDNGTY